MRGWYNWGNLQDGYLWFYLVNLGVTALLFLPAFFTADQRRFTVCAPAAVIWFICEFVVFQPNTYDNNKLLYAAYFLVCGVVASYMVETPPPPAHTAGPPRIPPAARSYYARFLQC